MQIILGHVDGEKIEEILKTHGCHFCNEPASTVISNLEKVKYNGYLFRVIPVCSKHFKALNRVLMGEFDLDWILGNETATKRQGIRLR